MRLTIVNYDKYNPRKDRTHHHWFRLENDIFVSDALFELDPDQKWFWIFLLAYVSKKQTSASVDVNFSVFAHFSGLSVKRVAETIELFEKTGLVTITRDHGNQPVTERGLHNNTIHNEQDNTNITAKQPPAVSEIESLYQLYPRKEGKSAGLKKLQSIITDVETFERVKTAILRYASHVQKNKTEPKFIKHFSTWVNHWTDWDDPNAGTASVSTKRYENERDTDHDAEMKEIWGT